MSNTKTSFYTGKMHKYQQEFVENLKKYRMKSGFSQSYFAELCDVATGTIGNIECGIAKPSFDLIIKMSEVFKIHPALLFSENPAVDYLEDKNARELLKEIKSIIEEYLSE